MYIFRFIWVIVLVLIQIQQKLCKSCPYCTLININFSYNTIHSVNQSSSLNSSYTQSHNSRLSCTVITECIIILQYVSYIPYPLYICKIYIHLVYVKKNMYNVQSFLHEFWEHVQHCVHVNKRFSLSTIVKCTFRHKCKCILELIKNNTSKVHLLSVTTARRGHISQVINFVIWGKNYTQKQIIYNGSSHLILD